ncbi:ATP-binding protein [Nonomuraea typhae]|uniref:ATP-binding protein n=1 Tax=Nonomuraea typhae TaxID=2603600 RepID=UPI0012FA6B13|nr:ATP-binding protein [Nonomuraea typhae]
MTLIAAAPAADSLQADLLQADVQRGFTGTPDQVGEARAWVLGLLQGCDRRDDVALAFTELGANAVLHSASGRDGGMFTVRLALSSTEVELSVVDQGPLSVPAQREADESGRGLSIVHQLADEYREEIAATGRTATCRFVITSGETA